MVYLTDDDCIILSADNKEILACIGELLSTDIFEWLQWQNITVTINREGYQRIIGLEHCRNLKTTFEEIGFSGLR